MSFRQRATLLLIVFLGSTAVAMDLSVLSEGFQNIQVHEKVTSSNPRFKVLESKDESEKELQKLLPRAYAQLNYRPLQQGPLSILMEEIFLRVVNTQLGNQICKEATLGRYDVMSFVFGAPTRLTKTVQNCLNDDRDYPTLWIKGTASARRYSFILYTGEPLKIQSWTTKEGVTFFFLRPQDVNEAHITRLYVHELAMYLLNPTLNVQGMSSSAIYSFYRPWMLLAMNLARAYQVEYLILKELGFTVQEPRLSCYQQINRSYLEIMGFASLLEEEEREFHEAYKNLLTPIERHWDLRPWSLGLSLLEEHPALCQQAMKFRFDNVTNSRGPRGPRPGEVDRPNTNSGTGGTQGETDRPNTNAGSGGPQGKMERPGQADPRAAMQFNFNKPQTASPRIRTGADMKDLGFGSNSEARPVFTKKLIGDLDDDKSGDGK